MITQFSGLKQNLERSKIDPLLRGYLINKIDEILYFLNRFEFFGMEGVWDGLSHFHLLFRRFAAGFDAVGEHELYNEGNTVVENCLKWLINLGGIYSGLNALAATSTLLLGSPAY
jgi:hypothetical protein